MQTCTDSLEDMLKSLRLTTFVEHFQSLAEKSEQNNVTHFEFLKQLTQLEVDSRHERRISTLLKQSKLPRSKLLSDFQISRIAGLSPSLVHRLAEGDFIDRCENILIFGNPGTGKTHLAIGMAREWCLRGRKVLYKTAAELVQDLLIAKKALELTKFIKKLDRYELLIIDDISYMPYERAEADVLFTLLSERYEQRSLMLTSNLVFSSWQQIFKDEMTTAAAIDRLVHYATVLELNAPSYRAAEAKKRQGEKAVTNQTNKKEEDKALKK